MRNLKKILALVMALVMSLSLVTIANASDFTDSDDITYEEAADVMSAIGIIEGFEDGSFDPDGTLTREQAAMLVARMLLGTNADRLGIEDSTFNDVAVTRWSAPAIEYCVSLGLIDGAGDGNFYPAGQLTGYAFAKILLTAIGYSSEKEGLVGSSWSVNTAALAMDVGLDSGLENGISSAVLSREEAAQMALNAIKTPLVAYDNDATITVNGAEVSIGSGDAYYITTTLAKEQRIGKETLSNSNEYTVEFGERYFPNLRLNREADEFERPSHTWVYEGEEIGSYIDYDLRVADYTEAITGRDLYDLLGKSTIQDYEITYYVDGAANDNIKASNMIRSNTVSYAETGNGVLTEVFVDHTNEEVTITSVNTYLAQANADYNETRGELSLTVYQNNATGTGKTIEVEDIADITEYKEGDFVLVNMAAIGTTGDKMEVVRINDVDSMVDCTVTSYSKGKTVTVDGEDYDYAEKAFYDDGVLDEYNQGYLGDYTYTFYFDQYGYVIGAEIYEGEANYVFITGYDINGSNLAVTNATASAIFLDGQFKEIQVSVSKTNDNIDDYNVGEIGDRQYAKFTRFGWDNVDGNGESEYNRWFRYTVNDSDVYTLTPAEYWVNEDAPDEDDEVNSANIRVGSGSTRAYGNDDSVYITVDTGAVDYTTQMGITKVNGIYTGVQSVDLRVFSEDNNYLHSDISVFALYDNNKDGRYIIGAVIVGEDMNNTKNYAYILDNEAQREYRVDGTDFWEVQAVVDGEIVTLTVADYDGAITAIKRVLHSTENGAMFRVTYNADGHVIEADRCVDKAFENLLSDYVYGSTDWNGVVDGEYRGIGTDYKDRDIEPDYDKIYNVDINTDSALYIGGNTLYIGVTNDDDADYGLALASAPIIVVQDVVDQAGNYVRQSEEVYSSVNQALDTLKDKNAFEGNLSAVLNDNGTAAYLVINSFDPVSIVTDDGSVGARGNVPTTYANGYNAHGVDLMGSRASGSVSISEYGMLNVNVEYTAPEWVPDNATVVLSVPLYYHGAYVRTINFPTAIVRDGKANVTFGSMFYGQYMGYDASAFSFGTATEDFSEVSVYYLDQANNDITDRLVDEVTRLYTSGSNPKALHFELHNSAAPDNVEITSYNMANGWADDITYQFDDLNDGWNTNTNKYASDDLPVIITLNLTGMTNLYKAVSNTFKLGGFAGTDAADAEKNLNINFASPNTDLETGASVSYTISVQGDTFNDAGTKAYHVVIDKLGFDGYLTVLGTSKNGSTTIKGADITISASDVEIEAVEPLKVVSATFTGGVATIQFNREVTVHSDTTPNNVLLNGVGTFIDDVDTVNSDATKVTVKLDDGKVFHTGDEITIRNDNVNYITDSYGYEIAANTDVTLK